MTCTYNVPCEVTKCGKVSVGFIFNDIIGITHLHFEEVKETQDKCCVGLTNGDQA